MRPKIGALLITFIGCQLYGQPKTSKPAITIPDLRGMWNAVNQRNGAVIANFDITQAANSLSMKLLRSGKTEALAFEGVFEDEKSIAGNSFDIVTHPDKPEPHPARITLLDNNRMEIGGDLMLRASPADAAIVREKLRLSFQKIPEKPFDLSGTWRAEGRGDVELRQVGSEFTVTVASQQQPFFKGQYTSNPVIIGQGWVGADNPNWTERRIMIDDLDHVWYEKNLLYRVSESPAVPCDSRNTYHISGYFARLRGLQAATAKDYKTARCWLTIGATWQDHASESLLAALCIDGVGGPADYDMAFDLATKSAAGRNTNGLFELAFLYKQGKGTDADPDKSAYWLEKAKQSAWINERMKPENVANSLGTVLGMVGHMVDFDLSMTPPSCFSHDVLRNFKTPCQ